MVKGNIVKKEQTVTIEKAYDGNVHVTETLSGRIYERIMGWRWIVIVNGEAERDFDRLSEAEHYIRKQYGSAAVPKRRMAGSPAA